MIAAFLFLFTCYRGVDAQEASAPSGTAPETQSPSEKASSLPQITVTGKTLHQALEKFISKATGASVWSQDHPMGRWRRPICPLVAGLSHTQGQLLFDRLADALTSVGIALGAAGCQPNFFVIVTAHPEADLKSLRHHDVNMFGGAQRVDEFINSPRPVRIWYNATLIDGDGMGASTFGGALRGIPAYRIATQVPDLLSVIALVDITRVMGLDWRQVADYVAMTGLTEINLDADVGDVPTILRLFSASGDARPQRLTAWDRAFIRALYVTDAVYRHQRVEMEKRMYRDLAP